jgi:hypothetical protein
MPTALPHSHFGKMPNGSWQKCNMTITASRILSYLRSRSFPFFSLFYFIKVVPCFRLKIQESTALTELLVSSLPNSSARLSTRYVRPLPFTHFTSPPTQPPKPTPLSSTTTTLSTLAIQQHRRTHLEWTFPAVLLSKNFRLRHARAESEA